MKQLIILTILACMCMVRSAPSTTSAPRQLILQDYNDEVPVSGDADDENDEIDTPSTTTTTTIRTTRRPPYASPTITRRRTRVPVTPPTSTFGVDDVMDEYENSGNYNGDFRYFRNIRDFVKKILQDLKKLIRNLNLADIIKIIQQFFNRRDEN